MSHSAAVDNLPGLFPATATGPGVPCLDLTSHMPLSHTKVRGQCSIILNSMSRIQPQLQRLFAPVDSYPIEQMFMMGLTTLCMQAHHVSSTGHPQSALEQYSAHQVRDACM